MNIKIDPAKVLSVGVTVLGVAGTILSSIVHKNEQSTMKAEIKEEIMKDLLNSKQD